MKKILHYLHIRASPAEVYRALTTAPGLAGWWSRSVTVEPGVGGLVSFEFLGGFNPAMEVTALEPDRRVDWTCVGGHPPWADNTFSFTLEDVDGSTGLEFVQIYAHELDDKIYGNYNFNWGFYLLSLKHLCETGSGTPYEPAATP